MGGSPKGNKQKKNVLCENSVEVRSNDGTAQSKAVASDMDPHWFQLVMVPRK